MKAHDYITTTSVPEVERYCVECGEPLESWEGARCSQCMRYEIITLQKNSEAWLLEEADRYYEENQGQSDMRPTGEGMLSTLNWSTEKTTVSQQFACPDCGERDEDSLVFIEDDVIECQSCGATYSLAALYDEQDDAQFFDLTEQGLELAGAYSPREG